MGVHAPQFPYINRVQVPVVDQCLRYHTHVPVQILVIESVPGEGSTDQSTDVHLRLSVPMSLFYRIVT